MKHKVPELTPRHVGFQITAGSFNSDRGRQVCYYFGVDPHDVHTVVQWVDPATNQGVVQFWGYKIGRLNALPRMYWSHEGTDDFWYQRVALGQRLVATHTYDPAADLLS